MPDFDFGTVLSVVKHVLQAVVDGNSKSPQVSGSGCGCGSGSGSENCKKTPQYVLTGLHVAIDTLILTKIFLGGDLNRNQVESLLSLFRDLDGYLHQFITLLTTIRILLPANGAPDTDKVKRILLVKQLRTLIDEWSTRRQGGLLQTYELSSVMGPVGTGAMGPVGTGFTGSVNPVGSQGCSPLFLIPGAPCY